MKVLLLSPAPKNIAPSQRYRFEHFIYSGNESSIHFVQKPFFNLSAWNVLHKKHHYFKKISGVLLGFIKRILLLFSIHQYDIVFIHREAAPIGPPVFEWLISKVFKKKIIYDFDDAIWVKIASNANEMAASLKCSWKVKSICKYSSIVTVGNDYLANFAMKYSNDVRIFPSLVNTEKIHNRLKDQHELPITIGWTGTFTNFHNIELVLPVIAQLQKKYPLNFIIIADKNPMYQGVDYQFIKWNLYTEINDLLKIHIGIMPLVDNDFERGKCSFKAIQYMSLGIPAVISPVGMNKQVLTEGVHGYFAVENWMQQLERLINDEPLRKKIGEAARQHIIENYSVTAYKQKFYQLFEV